jgi:hypothetical protein
MLNDDPYYFGIFRKSVSLFGTLFNNIRINRQNSNNNIQQQLLVPIIYANKDKMLSRVDAEPTLGDKDAAIVLPMMSFEIVDVHYDGDRKLPTMNKTVALNEDDANKMYVQYGPVPWNISFALHVYVKNAEDGTKIVEQIAPYFTPAFTPTVHLVPELGHVVDVPIILNSVQVEDSYTGTFDQRRALIWTLNFTMKTYLFGPVKNKPIIKFANTNYLVGNTSDNSGTLLNVNIQAGLDANGSPTTNSSISVGANNIFANSDFGYITTITSVIPR